MSNIAKQIEKKVDENITSSEIRKINEDINDDTINCEVVKEITENDVIKRYGLDPNIYIESVQTHIIDTLTYFMETLKGVIHQYLDVIKEHDCMKIEQQFQTTSSFNGHRREVDIIHTTERISEQKNTISVDIPLVCLKSQFEPTKLSPFLNDDGHTMPEKVETNDCVEKCCCFSLKRRNKLNKQLIEIQNMYSSICKKIVSRKIKSVVDNVQNTFDCIGKRLNINFNVCCRSYKIEDEFTCFNGCRALFHVVPLLGTICFGFGLGDYNLYKYTIYKNCGLDITTNCKIKVTNIEPTKQLRRVIPDSQYVYEQLTNIFTIGSHNHDE